MQPDIPTKSSIMIGLGETKEEIIETMDDLRENNVDMITIGQYLQPTKKHLKVVKYYHPSDLKNCMISQWQKDLVIVKPGRFSSIFLIMPASQQVNAAAKRSKRWEKRN